VTASATPAPAGSRATTSAKEKANGLPRGRRLLRSNDFARLERQGVRAHGSFVTIVGRAGGKGRVGFTVSKKVGNAVMRNYVKRRLRDIARRHKDKWQGRDVILIAKPEAAGRTLDELERDVLATLTKLDVTRGAHGNPPRPPRPNRPR
jgi:ribonuclease P protein component